jgi:hypothetical protein
MSLLPSGLDGVIGLTRAAADALYLPLSGGTLTGAMIQSSTTLLNSSVPLANGAGVQLGTLTNAPTLGNPTKWVPIIDSGVTRYIPAW